MTCGVCGEPVRAGGSAGGVPVYRCSSGSHVKRRVELVDGVVEAYVLALLEREGIGAPTPATVPPDVRGKPTRCGCGWSSWRTSTPMAT